MASKAKVHVYRDAAAAGRAAAEEARGVIASAISARGVARIIVGTGNSQDHLIDALTSDCQIQWPQIEVFHLDEYVGMSIEHPASFRGWLKRRVADVVVPRRVHYLNGDAPDLAKEMQRYAAELARAPIDLAFIGFGENGHIAFNDPHDADFNDPLPVKKVILDEICRRQQVGEGHFKSLESCPTTAITLTCPIMLAAEAIISVVPDRRKAQAVQNALLGEVSTACPASAVREHSHASIYLDAPSASLLPRSLTGEAR